MNLLHRSLSKCTVLFPSWRSGVSMTDDIDDDNHNDDNNLTTKSRTFLMLSYFFIIHMPTMKMDYRGKMQISCLLRDQRFDFLPRARQKSEAWRSRQYIWLTSVKNISVGCLHVIERCSKLVCFWFNWLEQICVPWFCMNEVGLTIRPTSIAYDIIIKG